MRLWLRNVVATFTGDGGELVVSKLKIAFDVTKTVNSSQNEATIQIWNRSGSPGEYRHHLRWPDPGCHP